VQHLLLTSPLQSTKGSKGRNIRKTKREDFTNKQKKTVFFGDQPEQDQHEQCS
jgi:hypothetical protein